MSIHLGTGPFLNNKNAIVTGGSRGIGRAITESLVHLGANVAFLYRNNDDEASKLMNELSNFNKQLMAIKADVTNEDNVKSAISQVNEKFGSVDILINNAGITADNLLVRMQVEQWDNVISTNLTGTYNTTKAILRGMIKNKSGRIINITSVVGEIGNLGQANYAAAKAGIIGFTKSTAREVATRGITVNAVAPGFVETEMTEDLSDEQKNIILQAIPMKKYAQPQDIASMVSFLCSEDASYITGQTFNVDGGLVMY